MSMHNPDIRQVTASQARQNFQDLIDSVFYTKQPALIVKRGKPWVLIQPLEQSTDAGKDTEASS